MTDLFDLSISLGNLITLTITSITIIGVAWRVHNCLVTKIETVKEIAELACKKVDILKERFDDHLETRSLP